MKKFAISFLIAIFLISAASLATAQEQKELPESDDTDDTNGIESVCETYEENPVVNCGFETGPEFYGWTRSGAQDFTYVAPGCRHSGLVGACIGPLFDLGFVSQFIPTNPGESYDIFFWLARQGAGGTGQFQVSWDGEIIYDRFEGRFPYEARAFYGLAASGKETEVKFGFRSAIGYFHFDDVVILSAVSSSKKQ